jgi:hypothetical protein
LALKIGCDTRAVGDLKKMADKLATQIPALEEKVLDGLNKLHAKELSLERTTIANEVYKSQNAQLTKKLEGKLSSPFTPVSCGHPNDCMLVTDNNEDGCKVE